MGAVMISQEELLQMWRADPTNAWQDYSVAQGPDVLGSSDRVAAGNNIHRDWEYRLVSYTISSWQAACIKQPSGGPQPVRSGWAGGEAAVLPWYEPKQFTVNTFWVQYWSGGNPSSGTQASFYSLAGEQTTTNPTDPSWITSYYEASVTLNLPVFDTLSDYQHWIDCLRAWRADPDNTTLWDQLVDALHFSLNPRTPIPVDPNEDPNTPKDEEGGGNGDHNRPVDSIPIPDPHNAYTAATSGFISVYAVSRQQMRDFADDMYATSVWDAIKLFFSSPLDFIVGCAVCPFTPEVGDAWYPKFGLVTFPHAYRLVENQFKVIDCGSITIEEYGKNCFDYAPYTKIQIWLPYIGYRDLNVDEVMGKTITVKYICDCVSGDCVAFISTQVKPQGLQPFKDVVIAQHHGNCIVQVPVGQASFDNFISSSISGVVNGVIGMAQSVAGDADLNSAINGLKSTTIGKINGLKPTVARSGSVGGSAGFSSIEYPYIVRTFPRQSLPSNYNNIMGYPSNIGGTLGSGFSGVAVVEDIQLNNIPALEPERAEIMEMLRKGVII